MLPLKDQDRVRILSAVHRRGGMFRPRRIAAITVSLLILLAVPLLGLIRVDLWRGDHILLGESVDAITALKGFVIAMAILYGFTFLTNMVVGRFFCGWGCPVGYVSRLGEDVHLRSKNPMKHAFAHLLGAGFVATFVGAVMLWWVDPRVVVEGSATAKAVTGGIFLALCAGGWLHAFKWRFGFCVSACPIGLYYRYVTSSAPVGIVFLENPDPCIQCGACEKVCPVDIDPKNLGDILDKDHDPESPDAPERYGDAECIRCGDCVEACRMVFANREGEQPPLRFGFAHKDHAPTTATAPESVTSEADPADAAAPRR